ncbi:MAG: helix-turn-helix domain-containing protein [Corynebacterium camporealensis]|uniref:helix-turn-helix domain-containing protein n=1 Tax=Corynebacterium camporealensis TaxID=161896 RepID=UPI002A91BCA1|nr:helix-turn-helix domain-containing protein [Corynebacterium camporealensis]MDY5840164.1 helix-turn-helix domain-containing protein [Corynebacterium camporealensis]
MSLLRDVLRHLTTGSRIPDALRSQLNAEEIAALRSLEAAITSNQKWRIMSMQLLEVAQLLNKDKPAQQVFRDIVKHARTLLGSDIGYISLNDPDSGKTNVLTTSGVVTEEFRTIRMPMGTGVLGLVAATNEPAWTYDHAQDPQVTHVDYVDHAVQAEGIHGILGAPVQINGETIGALLVGDRHPRNYTTEDITALTMLGALTSVALETSRVIEAQQESMAALTAAQEDLESNVADLHRLNHAGTALLQVLSAKPTFQKLADVLSTELESPVALWNSAQERFIGADFEGRALETAGLDVDSVGATPVDFNGRHLGTIYIERDANEVESRVIDYASAAFSAIALFDEALTSATSRKVDDLVYAAAIGTIGEQEKARLKQMTRIDLNEPDDLYFVGLYVPSRNLSRTKLEKLVRGEVALTKHDEHFCALVQPRSSIKDALRDVLDPEETAYASAVALSSTTSAQEAHDMTMEYLRAAMSLKVSNQVVSEETLGALGLILGSDSRALDLLTTRAVGALSAYDDEHDTDLEETLYQYFLSGQRVSAAAKAMYVHTNTVRQRLERATRLLGPGWDTGQRSLDIQMALRVRALGRGHR